MARYTREFSVLARELEQARRETARLTESLGRANLSATNRRGSACSGGACANSGGSGSGTSGTLARGATGALSSAVTSALAGDLRRALRSLASSMVRSIASFAGRSAGGGLGGNLLSSVVGGGLSLLVGKLFPKRQRVQVDNTVRAEVLNFPRFASLDFAANPASRLFGGRAVARGPAFKVEIAYRDGAEDLVSARVASRLADLNSFQGVV